MATQPRDLDVDLITRGRLERGVASLGAEFVGSCSPETVERYVIESLEALPARRIQEFIPLLVHRFARERLRALGQVEGRLGKDVPEVLFVCVHNAGRSQMAAALLDHYAKGKVHVRSRARRRRVCPQGALQARGGGAGVGVHPHPPGVRLPLCA